MRENVVHIVTVFDNVTSGMLCFVEQAELLSYETGEKAAEVELLRERVQLLEEEVREQEGKTNDAQSEVKRLRREGQ